MRLLATLPREQDSTSYTGPLRIPAASPSGCAVSGQRFPVDRTPLLVRHAQRPTNPLGLRGGPRQTGVRPSGPSQSDSSLPGRLESGTLRDQRIPSGSAEVRARLESDRRDLPSPTPRYPEGWNLAGTRWVRIRQEPLRPGAGIRFGRSRFGRGPDSLRQEPLRPGAGIVATGAASARGRIGYYVHTYQPGADSAGPVRVTESRILVCIPARCRPQIFGQAAGPVPRLWPVPRICAWTYLAFSFARRRLVRWSFVLTNHTG